MLTIELDPVSRRYLWPRGIQVHLRAHVPGYEAYEQANMAVDWLMGCNNIHLMGHCVDHSGIDSQFQQLAFAHLCTICVVVRRPTADLQHKASSPPG